MKPVVVLASVLGGIVDVQDRRSSTSHSTRRWHGVRQRRERRAGHQHLLTVRARARQRFKGQAALLPPSTSNSSQWYHGRRGEGGERKRAEEKDDGAVVPAAAAARKGLEEEGTRVAAAAIQPSAPPPRAVPASAPCRAAAASRCPRPVPALGFRAWGRTGAGGGGGAGGAGAGERAARAAARASRGGRRRGLTRAGADSARVFTIGPIYTGAGKKIWTAEIHCEKRSDGR
jgi:hypothetical protein